MIDVDGVYFAYHSKYVLENITFSIDRGKFFGIVGPNGTGKSTLLKVIGRALKPSKGTVKLSKKDVWSSFSSKEFAKNVSVIPQTPFYNFLRVEEFILTGRIPHLSTFQFRQKRDDIEAIEESFELCGLNHIRNKFMHRISGGERQLVFLARALVSKPKVLIMDEPLSSLDINNQEKILYLLKNLIKRFDLTIIGVLHDLNVVSEFADVVLVLKDGRVKAIGRPEDVIDKDLIKSVYGADKISVFKRPGSFNPFVCIVNN
jgi:iron complex transport system ATP-binding protein